MNTWQILRQIRYLLLTQKWGTSSNPLFPTGSVAVTAGFTPAARNTFVVPFCLIWPGNAEIDPEHQYEPDLVKQAVHILVATAIPGDAVGEKPILGANVPDRTKSEGRGVLELEEELFNAVKLLTTDSGIIIEHVSTSASKPDYDDAYGYIVRREYIFTAWATASRFYHDAIKVSASGASGGQITASWTNAPTRFDTFQNILRYKSGSVAPTSATDGTGFTLSSNLATSATITGLASGTYSLAIFVAYDETNVQPTQSAAQADRYSAGVSKTSLTVP